MKYFSRRALGIAVAAALGASTLMPVAALAGENFSGTELTYWGGLIFSDDANRMLEEEVIAWGEANGVETEVVMVNQNETIQKVSAAVSAGTMPDVIDVQMSLLLLLSRQGVFLPLDDLYGEIGAAQGGWFDSVDAATDITEEAGARTGIPFGIAGNLLLRRNDVLEAAGYTDPPATWAELVEQSSAVNQPPLFGLGLALSNVNDANVQISVMHSYGGRIADDAGENVMIKSAETEAYLNWLLDAWNKGVFPPGNTIWDGGGDNQAYLSGQAVFVANTGSIGIASQKQDPELFEASRFSSLPAGPMGTFSPISPHLRAIPADSDNAEAAKALIKHLAQPEFMNRYYDVAIYGPVLNGQEQLEAFSGSNTILNGLLDLVKNGTAPGYPDVFNAPFAEVFSTFLIPRMAQRVVVDGWSIEEAMDEAQTQGQAIYNKY